MSRALVMQSSEQVVTMQVRSMKRARDVRDQLVGLMERVELEMESSAEDHDAIKKVGRKEWQLFN